MVWWRDNAAQYPHTAKVAQCYLSAPPTSVASEHLFSTAGDLYSDQHRHHFRRARCDIITGIGIGKGLKYQYRLISVNSGIGLSLVISTYVKKLTSLQLCVRTM